MRCKNARSWFGWLLGLAVSLQGGNSFAETPKLGSLASEWRTGMRFSPTHGEMHSLCAGTALRLGANSTVEVQQSAPLPTPVKGLGAYAYAAKLTSGRVDIVIDTTQKPANGVLIRGPRRTSVLAQGGHVAVATGPTSLAVGVLDGKEAIVTIGSTKKRISVGKAMVISPENPLGAVSSLLQAPEHVTVNRPVLAIAGATDLARAVWDPVPQAQQYFVFLINTETKAKTRFKSNSPELILTGLEGVEPGRYEVRVVAARLLGIDSAPSEPVFVNVVGLGLPKGAFLWQGRVYLGPQQQLALSYVDGLESAYDTASAYFAATRIVSLRGPHATTLHLRVPGSDERVSLDLVPRSIQAQVAILPAKARWPRDKVVVRIHLPEMSTDAPQVEMVPIVTVNNQAVPLDWVKTQRGMDAVIAAPPVYPGPWVLRAEVADQHGVVLGRNFLEIGSIAAWEDGDSHTEIRGDSVPRAKH